MATTTTTMSSKRIVVDASAAVALFSNEPTAAHIDAYLVANDATGCELYVPGVFISEVLFALCRKVQDTPPSLTHADHATAITLLVGFCQRFKLTPRGDLALV